ncbi:hypothetical protein [Nonomuraea wenchangensis]|uniref:Uncharacterized protein n=1 Tax=Nonomuraea wenchangensis TaxID=568860 RepID=A0A1I0LUE7_9ACTN|nr:hypothetical protein [Nonomuraea wenchangensis]SEU46760.1 hypothetical protein SAMN05421811_127139 [Nonomuraea wenchangensis]
MSYFEDDYGTEMEAIEDERRNADLEQAQMEREGNRLAALRRRGICTHGSVVGYVGKVIYPEQEGLQPGQSRCTEGTGGCKRIFNSDAEWYAAQDAL